MTMMTIAICDDMQADARRLHKQLDDGTLFAVSSELYSKYGTGHRS
mgnify:CR=1 FL=1